MEPLGLVFEEYSLLAKLEIQEFEFQIKIRLITFYYRQIIVGSLIGVLLRPPHHLAEIHTEQQAAIYEMWSENLQQACLGIQEIPYCLSITGMDVT